MNNVSLIGRIGSPVERKKTADGKDACSISIAVRRNATVTDWFNCTAFDRTADTICTYCKTGDQIGIEGSLYSDEYKTVDGQKRTAVKIGINRVTLLTKRDDSQVKKAQTPEPTHGVDGQSAAPSAAQPQTVIAKADVIDVDLLAGINPDDLPF
jgi:single-strand DNA-binding protein